MVVASGFRPCSRRRPRFFERGPGPTSVQYPGCRAGQTEAGGPAAHERSLSRSDSATERAPGAAGPLGQPYAPRQDYHAGSPRSDPPRSSDYENNSPARIIDPALRDDAFVQGRSENATPRRSASCRRSNEAWELSRDSDEVALSRARVRARSAVSRISCLTRNDGRCRRSAHHSNPVRAGCTSVYGKR